MKPNEMMPAKPRRSLEEDNRREDQLTIQTGDELTNGKAAPVNVANNAGDAIEASHKSAELLRDQGEMILAIAQTIKTEGDALALDIESRAERFSVMIATFNEYASQAQATFSTERARLDQFKMPTP